jgi:phosphoglycolate phosphatase
MTLRGSIATRPVSAIVDLDGTLVDTIGDFDAALNRTHAELGLPPIERGAILRMVGKGSGHLVRSALAHVGADAALFDQAMARYQAHYAEVNGLHSEVYAGAREGLGALAEAGMRLVCLTNKPTAFAKALLEAKGLSRFFEGVYGGDLFERNKPDPLPIVKTCEVLGTPPARTLVIGDSSNDARAARAAGCPVILVTYGYNHGEPVREVDADGFVDSLVDVARLFRPGDRAAPL